MPCNGLSQQASGAWWAPLTLAELIHVSVGWTALFHLFLVLLGLQCWLGAWSSASRREAQVSYDLRLEPATWLTSALLPLVKASHSQVPRTVWGARLSPLRNERVWMQGMGGGGTRHVSATSFCPGNYISLSSGGPP